MDDVSQQIYEKIQKLIRATNIGNDLTPILPAIRERFMSSIEGNLRAGGRWDGNLATIGAFSGGTVRWQPLAESTKRGYKRKGLSNLSRTLDRHAGGLVSTIDVRTQGKSGIIMSANKIYAQIQNMGGDINIGEHQRTLKFKAPVAGKGAQFAKKKAKGKKITSKTVTMKSRTIHIPASPFLVVQEEDLQWVFDLIADFVIKKIT